MEDTLAQPLRTRGFDALDLLVVWAVCAQWLVGIDDVEMVDERHIVRVGGAADKARFRFSEDSLATLDTWGGALPADPEGWLMLASIPTTHSLIELVGPEWSAVAEVAVEGALWDRASRLASLVQTARDAAATADGSVVEFDCSLAPAQMIARGFPWVGLLEAF